ncbi:hypothetical protein C8Q69DRAFT_420326 [Paecilomyces variotii]|uniref:C2H2-type domain-containing protein n=1 Tax=Byssochlamys spectabilis TaxID=264951 RepID=A0A443HQX8_BYSSP|nr:hypothetical protein C8Q69DRAFT_420326 [Paecilomyces variotii]KAJ9363121.1 transcriptional regulator family: C2H2 zinc finger [Paecilomyces variotii]RWQ94232.1 hypothetical protein C8Q69DRAFT_420326 [Paecilomyces variotii]
MALKRKAASEAVRNAKRIQTQALDSSDPIYGEPQSDIDYESSENGSVAGDDGDEHTETPMTPFSPSSSKYPSELKTHLCPFDGCTKAFNRPARLQEHIRSHNNERMFSCTYDGCDKTFLRASHLNHHIKSAHTSIRDYVCDREGCGKSFVTGSRLRRHLAAHDGRDKYRCTEYPPCSETFRKHSTLQKHVMMVHQNRKPFPCPHVDPITGQKCGQAFDTAGHLKAHEARLHTEKRFSCAECSQQAENDTKPPAELYFTTYAMLQAHIRTVHPPRCANCPIVCSTSRELRRHLEVVHGDVSLEERKIFPCTVPGCDRSFTKKGNLTVHVRTVHDGEKRFVCGEIDLSSSKKVDGWNGEGCGKRYGSKLALEEHVRTAHLGFQNAKAERRQRLGLSKAQSRVRQPVPSALATLTGEGYAEETGRHIACFVEGCSHRFHRDYDLWVHMNSKHNCSEDEIQNLFTQRALLTAGIMDDPNPFGIYGMEFDDEHITSLQLLKGTGSDSHTAAANASNCPATETDFFEASRTFDDMIMEHAYTSNRCGEPTDFTIPNDDTTMIDPVLAYNLMEG